MQLKDEPDAINELKRALEIQRNSARAVKFGFTRPLLTGNFGILGRRWPLLDGRWRVLRSPRRPFWIRWQRPCY
jgi:hypothetical protein